MNYQEATTELQNAINNVLSTVEMNIPPSHKEGKIKSILTEAMEIHNKRLKILSLYDEKAIVETTVTDLINTVNYMNANYSYGDLQDENGFSGMEVRIQLIHGGCYFHSGDSQYDADHRGHWGYATLAHGQEIDYYYLLAIATEMVEEALSAMM